ncbi:MAG: thermonuclease family protein [Sphingomicrobium sp.]
MFAGFWGAAALLGAAYGAGWLDKSPAPPAVPSARETKSVGGKFGLCPVGGGTNCVVDGDTMWINGENIRIADIDAPETHEPGCSAEKSLGERATRRLHGLVNSGTVTLEGIGRDSDSYGRKLRVVLVDGKSVGDTLVDEELARWYEGGRRSWC